MRNYRCAGGIAYVYIHTASLRLTDMSKRWYVWLIVACTQQSFELSINIELLQPKDIGNVIAVTLPSLTKVMRQLKQVHRQASGLRMTLATSLEWRHNGWDSVSNHQPHDHLLNRLFRRRSKKTSKLRVTGLCGGNSPGTGEFPAQMASNVENVSIWWRHHVSPRSHCTHCPVVLIRLRTGHVIRDRIN